MTRNRTAGRRLTGPIALAAGLVLAAGSLAAHGLAAPGTPGKDVHVGGDDDNAGNPLIQPPGVAAKLHMDNTDVLFGRGDDDLLVGRKGSDTLLGGAAADILVGGPEAGTTDPNSDVIVGDRGDDVNIWAPGDGSDAFVGFVGYDTSIFAPFVTESDGSLVLERFRGRQIPRVTIDELPRFSCTIVQVPASAGFGFQQLVRFNVNGNPVISVRHKDVERVLCPSPRPGKVQVAFPNSAHPGFREVPLSDIRGLTGAIVAPAS